MKKLFLIALFFGIVLPGLAQQKYTLSGYVKDGETGEALIGATVFVKENLKGVVTNQYGYYSITLEKGKYTFSISYTGFEEFVVPVELDKDQIINQTLKLRTYLSKEVIITDEAAAKNVQGSTMGTFKMNMEEIKKLPAFLGEVDVLKSIQLMPGIQSAGDGNSGFYVRGGGPDQNLILLDEAVIYNASHLFGFFSVFNSDAIKNVELTKGSMPAQYGGRLSSVLEINMKEGNNKKFQAEGGIGLISSRLTLQGPLVKDKISYVVSARRTYAAELVQPIASTGKIKKLRNFKGIGYYFFDLNGKINYQISDKDRIYFSSYYGKDAFSYRNKKGNFRAGIDWGNAMASIRWNHVFNNKLFFNATTSYTKYDFQTKFNQDDFEFVLQSGIRDYNGKLDFTWFPSILHNVKFGAQYTYHSFTPSSISAKQGETVFDVGGKVVLNANDYAFYINDDWDISDNLKLNAGLRYSFFEHVGPFKQYVRNDIEQIVDTVFYEKNKHIKTWNGPEPRASLRYSLTRRSSVKASYTHNMQYIHLANLSGVSMPTDIWLPSTSVIKPEIGNQYAVGYFQNFKDNTYETSLECYYKTMQNQVEYKEGALPEETLGFDPDGQFTFGKGWSYGAELFLKKRTGKYTGWIGYTLSWTKRNFPLINNGQTYYAKYDRRHDINVVQTYTLNENWSFSAIFIYGTGNAATLPVARYFYEGEIVNQYTSRNDFRLPAYHRLDVSATYTPVKKKRFEQNWNFSVFNVYCRYNPYFIYFDNEGSVNEGTLKVKAKMVSLFPVIPSVTWNFKF